MFEPEAYKITADPFVPFSFLEYRRQLAAAAAAAAAEEKAKKANKANKANDANKNNSDSDEDEDDESDEDDARLTSDDEGGGGGGGGGGDDDGWSLDRRVIYDCLHLLLMTKLSTFSDDTHRKYMVKWSVSRSQLPF